MANWNHRVKIKHLFTESEDHESIQKSMNAIADVLQGEPCFMGFNIKRFREIPKGDNFFGPSDYANKLLANVYDFADYHRIWIE
jgi:hypothetical protein